MGTTVVVRILEVGLFAGFFIHIIQGLVLTFQNQRKRKLAYAVNYGNRGSTWYSRSMGLLGTILLIFLIIHWNQFWIPSRFTGVAETWVDGKPVHDLYGLMKSTFAQGWVVAIYVLACASLAYHLLHGFQSAFRTLGLGNSRYMNLIRMLGTAFSVVVPLTFAMMPVSMYLQWIE
jgi:succinate dehydrogenase / fumarate reductase cytochrome b subunit